MRKIDKLIIHCTATPEGRTVTVVEIDKWHREKAEIVKQKIITVVENIRLQYPYLNEI